MSRRIADLLIKIGADSYEFQQKANQVEKGLGQLEKRLSSIGKSLSLKVTAPLTALGVVALQNADTQAKAETKVATALKSTGNQVGYNLDQLKAYASELQSKTIFGDETILNDVTTRLLAFTNITGDNFKRTQQMALDMSTALEMDLGSAAPMLGKALDDPIGKMSALSRAGINFTDEQKAMVKQLVETGDTAKAQGVILDALEQKFGGQAEAAAKVGMGALKQLKNSWGDFLEQIGNTLTPFINKIAAFLGRIVSMLQGMSPTMQKVIVVIGGIAAAIGPLLIGISGVIKLIPMLSAGFSALLSPVGIITAAVLALAAAFAYAKIKKQELTNETAENSSLEDLQTQLAETRRQMEDVKTNTVKWRFIPNMGGMIAGGTMLKTYDIGAYGKLQKQEELLSAAIEVKNKKLQEEARIQADATRMQEEAVEQTRKMMEELQNQNFSVETATGLIGTLQQQISDLEKKKLVAQSPEELATINAQLEEMRENLSYLQNITPEQAARMKNRGNEPTLAPIKPMAIPMPQLEYKMPDIQPVISKYQQQAKEIFTSVRKGIFDWADDTSEHLQDNFKGVYDAVQNYTQSLVERGWKFSEALDYVSNQVASTMKNFDQQVSQFLAESITAAAEAIGQMLAGDLGFGGLMTAILKQFASFLKNIGAQLIEFGVMVVAFKSALKSVLANPWVAIGVGAAMVAAAALMTALINKNAQAQVPALAGGGLAYGKTYAVVGDNPNAGVDPEVIAPLSRLQQMLPAAGAAQNVNITLGGELTAKGRDLVYVLGKENFKTSILGG